MHTWKFTFEGNLASTRKQSGTGLRGEVKVRATTLDDALAKFYLVFTAPMVRITSITDEGEYWK